MPCARTHLVAGLAVAACFGLPVEMTLPAGRDTDAFTAPAAWEMRHAADPGSPTSLPGCLRGRIERPTERPAAVDGMDDACDRLTLAAPLNELVALYWTTGHYGAAELLLKHAIAVDERTHGSDHPALAVLLDNLAGLYQATGRHSAAEPLLKRAVVIDMKAYGPDHPNLASRLNNLAVLYWATGRRDAAEPLFARAIALLKKSLSPGHPVVAAIRENYVNLLMQLDRRRGDRHAAVSGQDNLSALRGVAKWFRCVEV
jgi:tetratricopeptide (TPR) repeat protein